jgi:CubicO group peptidase (beta-lactamase class C family)
VPAVRDITIKDLLTHTSGLSSGPMGQSEVRKNRRKPTETLADYIPRLGSTPLEFQPGSRWMYSASDGIDVLARVVEVASGVPLDRFLKQRIFVPLDMPNTSHYPTDAQLPQLVTAYRKTDKGLVKTENSLSMSSKVYFAGGGGLVGGEPPGRIGLGSVPDRVDGPGRTVRFKRSHPPTRARRR